MSDITLSLWDREVRAWIDDGLKAITSFRDPVELNEGEVRQLIDGLTRLLQRLE